MHMDNNEAAKSLIEHAAEVASHSFAAGDYRQSSDVARGIAETHEQMNDAYTAGTSDGVWIRDAETDAALRNMRKS